MATISFKNGDDYALKLSRLETGSEKMAKKAIFEAAKIVADKIRVSLNSLPIEKYRTLQNGEKFSGLSPDAKSDLADSFGVTPIKRDRNGDWNCKIGFDGYGRHRTPKYPKGLPNQLLARALESGSSVREKTPFVRPAVNATKSAALKKMREVIDEETQKIMKG